MAQYCGSPTPMASIGRTEPADRCRVHTLPSHAALVATAIASGVRRETLGAATGSPATNRSTAACRLHGVRRAC